MDIKAYIESGAIEAYVLGLASAEETAEIGSLRRQYPEVHNAILAFEMQLEQTAMSNAEAPPAGVKQELQKKLSAEFRSNDNGKVIAMQRGQSRPFWKYLAAASVILLVASSVLNYYLYNRYQDADTAYRDMLVREQTLQASNNVMNTRLDSMNLSMKIMTDPAILPVGMIAESTPKQGQDFRATVYWDTKTKDVYLFSNKLPAAPEGKQYQLWAIVDGQPVDAGMISNCTGVCFMKNIPRAQAFAITLEKQGGSPSPTMDQLYVAGKI